IGKMLYVDLSSGTTESRTIPRKWVDQYSGQKGLGSRILMEGFDPKTDPRAPDNRLVLATSIMGGTIVSCSAKLAMITKSPQTGTISDGSVGGHLGAELKYAGYDAVLITGKAPELSYLYIDPDKAEIRTATDLAGAGTFKTDEILKQNLGDDQVKILAIGPAGENQVPFACVSSEKYRQLGRGGIGAVMGSKNLKAVVVRGWLDVTVPDIEKCMRLAAEMHQKDEITSPEYEIYTDGTPVIVAYTQEAGVLPTRNFQEGQFEGYKNISAPAMKEIRRNKKACFACGIACGNYVKTDQSEVEGPEYETIALCGSSIGNADREKLVEFNAVCDDLGLDTISVGGVLAFMMEATEKGIKDFGVRFGEVDKALDLVGQIARLEGVGADAALGTKQLSAKFGGQEFAMQIKGLELPGYDPRGSWAMGIGYATAPRGGCHMSAFPIEAEAFGDLDPFTFDGKAKLVAELQNAQFAKFSIGVCDFWPIDDDTLAKLFEVTYGGSWTAAQIVEIGERIFNLQRMFNVMAGFSREEDRLPARLHKELLKAGPPKDIPMSEEAFQQAMDEYYAFRGWDDQGRPTVAKLKALGIETEFISAYEKSLK
ncbi:MAG: aldehyde ferredoxin oxidoreductase family protein, partial [Desulfobacterales bacterium]